MNSDKRQMLRNLSDTVQSAGRQLNSHTIEEEDLLKIAKCLDFSSAAIKAIVELPDRK